MLSQHLICWNITLNTCQFFRGFFSGKRLDLISDAFARNVSLNLSYDPNTEIFRFTNGLLGITMKITVTLLSRIRRKSMPCLFWNYRSTSVCTDSSNLKLEKVALLVTDLNHLCSSHIWLRASPEMSCTVGQQ